MIQMKYYALFFWKISKMSQNLENFFENYLLLLWLFSDTFTRNSSTLTLKR